MWIGWNDGWYTNGSARRPTTDGEAREWMRSQLRHTPELMLNVCDSGPGIKSVYLQEVPNYGHVLAEGTWPEIWETFMAHVRMRR